MPIDMPPADTPANAAADLNVNPKAAEVQHVVYKTFDDREVANWTPEDLIKTLETVGKWSNNRGYYLCPVEKMEELFSILAQKVITWEKEDKITYEQMSKIMNLATERPIGMDGGLLSQVSMIGKGQEVIDFLGKFVLFAEKDPRYYDLVEHVLTHQALSNAAEPLAANLSQRPRFRNSFKEKVLNKLPETIQKRLSEETYYFDYKNDDGEIRTYCYSLLDGRVISVD